MTPARGAVAPKQPISTGWLREQLELYRKIFANSIDGIAVIDTQGFYLEQNRAHRELTGYSDIDLAGKTPAIHLGEQTTGMIVDVLRNGESFRGEVLSRSKTGEQKKVDLAAFPVFNESGETICFVGIKRDVTQRERAEEERAARLRELENV